MVSDTKELAWYVSRPKNGWVSVETDRTQALIGFLSEKPVALRNLSTNLTTGFASVVLSSMDDKAISRSSKMLLTAGSRVSNTAMKWNDARTRAAGGESPTLIEPVSGTVTLRNLSGATEVSVAALDGAGHAVGDFIRGKKTSEGWTFPVGSPATTWYVISIRRR